MTLELPRVRGAPAAGRMPLTRMVWLLPALCALLHATCQATPFPVRADSKKPLGPEAEKALAAFCEAGAPAKLRQLETQMEWMIGEIGKAVKISAEEAKKLKEDSAKPVAEALESWKKVSVVNMRPYLLTYDTDKTQAERVAGWKADQVAEAHSIMGWTLPELMPSWQAAVKVRLGEERGTKALEACAAKRTEINKEMDGVLERWASTGRVPMDEELRGQIEGMRKSLKLEQAKVDELFAAAKKLVDEHVASEIVAGRELLNSLVEEQRVKTMGNTTAFNTRFMRPKGIDLENHWGVTAAALIGDEMVKEWKKIAAAEKTKEEADIVDSLKTSELQARMQMEDLMAREVEGYLGALDLNDERKKKLEGLAKQAVDASIEAAKKGWINNIKKLSTAERKSRQNIMYFGISEEQKASKQPVWIEGVKSIVTQEETKRMQEALSARKTRMHGSLAQSTLAEMDKTLALSTKQRAELEPLLTPLMEPLLQDENQEYWSYQPSQLFNTAAKVDDKKVTSILDEAQLKQWKKLSATQPNYNRSNGVTASAGEPDPEAPKVDVDAEISRHLYQLGLKERTKHMEVMLAHVGDAKRVLGLPEEKVRRLSSAAKGAVEMELAQWRDNVERWVRSTVDRATPHTVKATLANLERSNYNSQGKGPQNQDIWRETVSSLLSPSEQTEWKKVIDARKTYRSTAIATMTANELDRRRRLTTEQFEKVRKLVAGVLNDYLPDIERYMSHSWHLQYYYALLPLAGVKDADLKAVLTERQWKLVQERDLADAEQYWEGIENYHKQRVEKGEDAATGGEMIIFDE